MVCSCTLSMWRACSCRYIKKWQELIPLSSIVMSLITCVCVMLLFAHIAACMLVLAAQLEGLPDGSWIVFYGVLYQARTRLLRRFVMLRSSGLHTPPWGVPESIHSKQPSHITCKTHG